MLLTLDREVCMIINELVKTIKTTIVDKTLFDLLSVTWG